MKHGHKAKEAKAKALDKDRTAKSGKAPSKKSVKTSGAKIPIAKKAAGKETAGKEAGRQTDAAAVKAAGKGRVKNGEPIAFTSPAVASAFKRAVKKYATALKRLTD